LVQARLTLEGGWFIFPQCLAKIPKLFVFIKYMPARHHTREALCKAIINMPATTNTVTMESAVRLFRLVNNR
jgi:hypothetical protein